MNAITSFRNENIWLSNFYPSPIKIMGWIFPTAENLYQAGKTNIKEEIEKFQYLTAIEAKRYGKQVTLVNDWNECKLNLMTKVITLKFKQNPILKIKLLETEDAYIAEGNYWNDTYWGIDAKTGKGANHLGQIIMQTRKNLLIEALKNVIKGETK